MATKIILICIVIASFFCSSCTNTKKIAYFRDVPDTAFRASLPVVEAPLQNDILNIKISSLNAKASADFNQSGGADGAGAGNAQVLDI